MVAYMNADTGQQTLETGRATFWSRSRQEVWVKGDRQVIICTLKKFALFQTAIVLLWRIKCRSCVSYGKQKLFLQKD